MDDILSNRLTLLRRIVRNGFIDAPAQVQGFVSRVLERDLVYSEGPPLYEEYTIEHCLDIVRFEGYPALARAGYVLGANIAMPPTDDLVTRFLYCIEQQRGRPQPRQTELAGDSLALLGIADGLRVVSRISDKHAERRREAQRWVRALIDQHGGTDTRLGRARLLASDLLEDEGRFGRDLARSDDPRVAALDLCLWRGWTDVARNVWHPGVARRRNLFKSLLTAQPPAAGELLTAASYLCAFDVLIGQIATSAVPDEHQVARILAETQGSFRRWRWEDAATRKDTMPARWLIDKEADVQAFLLAVLYPYFVDHLEDEQYLQGFGLRQGRFDFAVTSLGLIVEVKVIRSASDVNKLESEIADDLSLYFKEGNPFKTIIVYIYDDRDRPEPERYPAIRDALKRRSGRIVDVVIVQRPSMIPPRGERN